METVQTQDEALRHRPPDMPMYAWLMRLLGQPSIAPVRAPGKHTRAGMTKNHGQGQSKVRRKMTRESRRQNRRKR